MRLGDLDQLMDQVVRKKADWNNQKYMDGFNDCILRVRSMIHSAKTINPESLPIVQQLREELARVTAERDKIAQYELDACGEYCFGDSSTGISECEWLDSNGRCKLKEWSEGRKEADHE